MSIQDLIKQNCKRKSAAMNYLKHSILPETLRITLDYIIDACGSNCNYEVSWIGIEAIAEKRSKGRRTIQRHINILRNLGIIDIAPGKGRQEVIQWIKDTYDYDISKGKSKQPAKTKHRFNVYIINYDHPIFDSKNKQPFTDGELETINLALCHDHRAKHLTTLKTKHKKEEAHA